MKKHISKQNTEQAAEQAIKSRRNLLKTGGALLAGLATSAYAGKNGEIDTVTIYDSTKPQEKKEPLFNFKWGSQTEAAPAVPSAQVVRADGSFRPGDVQILFVDLQPTLVAGSQTTKPQALSGSAATLAKVARVLNIPMTFAVVPEGNVPATLIPELAKYANAGNTFSRQVVNPFMDQATVSKLASYRRKVLIIASSSSEGAGLQAVQSAIAAGYSVRVAVDAVGSLSERTETVALKQMETAGAITSSVPSLASLMAPDFSRQPGMDVRAVLMGQPVAESSSGW